MLTMQVDTGKSVEGAVATKPTPRARSVPTESAQPPKGSQPDYSAEQVREAAKELAGRLNMKVEVAHDERTGRQVVRIMSEDGDRLVRQMPPDAVIELADQARRGTLEGLFDSVA